MRLGKWMILLVALAACREQTKTTKVLEAYEIVPGSPQVDTATPKVLIDPTRDTNDFAINTPHQCDLYTQTASRKVDILWVVDSSGSMAPKQARLSANFQGFINQLVDTDAGAGAPPKVPPDFHIAV